MGASLVSLIIPFAGWLRDKRRNSGFASPVPASSCGGAFSFLDRVIIEPFCGDLPLVESGLVMMSRRKPRPKTVIEYINAAPKQARTKLREIRACIRKAAPGAKETLKWGMPAYTYHRILVTFAAFPHHIGFYPTPSAVKAFRDDLAEFTTASASIQFPINQPLPLGLIRKITEFRVRESLEKDRKWRT